MSRKLRIPPEFVRLIDPNTLTFGSDTSPLRTWFVRPENVEYVSRYVMYILSISDNERVRNLARLNARRILATVETAMFDEKMPPREWRETENIVILLDKQNRAFIDNIIETVTTSGDSVDPDWYMYNSETGQVDPHADNSYDVSSYSDGTWHPEHLFTNKQRNRDTGYWGNVSTEFDASPEASGLGHRYYSTVYTVDPNRRTQYLPSQYTVQRRPYERDIDESLKEGGISDRRTQVPRGYNMRSLYERSTD
jgi:hypothetical protein